MTNVVIATDAQKLSVDSPLIDVYELEIGVGTNNVLYFHAGKDLDNSDDDHDLIFDGNTYIALPIFLDGIDKAASGAMARPTLSIANVESIISFTSDFKTEMDAVDDSNNKTWDAIVDGQPLVSEKFRIEDLVGCRVTRRRTLEKYTGAVTPYEFDKETFLIDRVSNKNSIFVELELAAPVDFGGLRLPRRQVIGKYCPWVYQAGLTDSGKSACAWKKSKQLEGTDGQIYSFYFTGEDEPLVLASYFTGTPASFWKGAYSSSTTYTVSDFVSHGGLYWRCEKASTTGVTPVESSSLWQIVRTYTNYSSSVTYTVHASDPRRNSYVKWPLDVASSVLPVEQPTIWRAVQAGAGIEPGTNEQAWTRGDICGKLLKSCKIRYQALPAINGSGSHAHGTNYNADAIPSNSHNNNIPLPFGGFPGTRKFR
jgi:phage-related protein